MGDTSFERDGQTELVRAEEMVDSMGRAVAGFASRLGFEIMRGAALAREEAEDIWAEAQAIARSPQ